jgi:hypothetical protein
LSATDRLEALLRRLPLAIRQLRWRQADRSPFRVGDECDLEDLLRAVLPLSFDDVRLLSRTPSYAPATRTDLLLAQQRIVVTAKFPRAGLGTQALADQFTEDAAFYRAQRSCATLFGFVFDPEGLLHDPGCLETSWSTRQDEFEFRCVIATS